MLTSTLKIWFDGSHRYLIKALDTVGQTQGTPSSILVLANKPEMIIIMVANYTPGCLDTPAPRYYRCGC